MDGQSVCRPTALVAELRLPAEMVCVRLLTVIVELRSGPPKLLLRAGGLYVGTQIFDRYLATKYLHVLASGVLLLICNVIYI